MTDPRRSVRRGRSSERNAGPERGPIRGDGGHDRHGGRERDDGRGEHDGGDEHEGHGDQNHHGAHGDFGGHGGLTGLTIAANGLRLVPGETRFEPGEEREWTFEIRDAEGGTVTEFETLHGEPGHLIVVRRDLTRFQHLHPTPDADGIWSVALALPDPGAYRAFVDVSVGGRPTTLGTDLLAPGTVELDPRPGSTRRATVEGYEVTLRPEEVIAGAETTLEFEVRDGDGHVPQLEPYLDAFGHLVALREGDLAYLHVHPEAGTGANGRVGFRATFPTPGRYRLFLQVRPDGELVTAPFDVRVSR